LIGYICVLVFFYALQSQIHISHSFQAYYTGLLPSVSMPSPANATQQQAYINEHGNHYSHFGGHAQWGAMNPPVSCQVQVRII